MQGASAQASDASDARRDAPYGARLLAFALTTSALLGVVMAWLQRKAILAIEDPSSDWNERERLLASLDALARGEVACELLLAGLLLVGVIRYGRGLGDRLVHHLSLGAGACLALDAVRVAAFNVDMAWFADPGSHEALTARMQLWMVSGLALRLAGLGLLTAALTRGDRLVTGRRPWWPIPAAALLLLYPLGPWLGGDAGGVRGNNLIDWLPVIVSGAMLILAGAAVRQAARVDVGPPAGAWVRAAAGLERYRDATALRVLVVVCVAVFVFLARFTGFPPLATLGGLCVLGMLGPLIGLFQIAGLVRVADAPAARVGLGLALPLIGLGVASECAALMPIASFVLGGGRDPDTLRRLDLGSLSVETQGLAVLATIILLLSFRHLAGARAAGSALARCNALLTALISLLVLALGAWWLLPELRLHRDDIMLLVLGGGLGLLVTAIWMVVVYLRMLKELADAMASAAHSGAHSGSAEIQR